MGKRSDFKRIARDAYDTPREAVQPLVCFIKKGSTFCEPCAGKGQLISHLEDIGLECLEAFDIAPRLFGITRLDALIIDSTNADMFITNPPWSRDFLHPLIERLSSIKPTWLLFDADWMHTKQSAELVLRCSKIVSVGRVKWIPDTKMTGKDNCCWYLFEPRWNKGPRFYGR